MVERLTLPGRDSQLLRRSVARGGRRVAPIAKKTGPGGPVLAAQPRGPTPRPATIRPSTRLGLGLVAIADRPSPGDTDWLKYSASGVPTGDAYSMISAQLDKTEVVVIGLKRGIAHFVVNEYNRRVRDGGRSNSRGASIQVLSRDRLAAVF